MRSALATVASRRAVRNRSSSNLSTIAPTPDNNDYLPELAAIAATIVYRNPLPSPAGHPIFIINAAALPDTFDVDYDSLLPYVLARLPDEDDLITGTEYEIIFFAGGSPEGATSEKKQGPGMGWYLQAYNVLSRAMRKRLQRLYIVHPRTFVRVLISLFSTVVSPKFRRKIIHIGSLYSLQQRMPLQDLLIPPSALLHDRRIDSDIEEPGPGIAFNTPSPLPKSSDGSYTRLPRVLRETTSFILLPSNVVTEGLFRIPPHALQASIVHDAYDRGQKFIVWKEPGATYAPPDLNRVLLSEISLEESYGVHVAAALIKAWYRELRQPIVPESAYAFIRDRFQDYSRQITTEDLLSLVDPSSPLSVLTTDSRLTLTRHLLPLLHEITQHEPQNKMTAQNLAICFAITLLKGSNQIEDVKVSAILQRLLATAIEQWQELRAHFGLSETSFLDDIRPPALPQDYEDPMPQLSSFFASANPNGNQAKQQEDDAQATSGHNAQTLPKLLNKLPVRVPPMIVKPTAQPVSIKPPPPAVPKRKPARSISAPNETAPTPAEPPRYSTLYDNSTDMLQQDDAQPNPDDSAAPPYQAEVPSAVPASISMPKRKALVTAVDDDKQETKTASISQSPVQVALPGLTRPVSSSGNSSTDDAVFRKPSWPASARRPSDGIASLARPVLPAIQQSTPYLVTNNLAMPGLPKPRTPSPGLLQRMNSLDSGGMSADKATSPDNEKNYRLTPGRLSLKKASVDDLRRLYEERLDTVNGLARSDIMKRSNSAS